MSFFFVFAGDWCMLISSMGKRRRPRDAVFRRKERFQERTVVISMRKIFLLFVVFACIGMTAGCATLGGGGLADMSRRDVIGAVDELAAAYAADDPDGFMALVSVRYAGVYGDLEERVIRDMTGTPDAVYVMETGGISVDDAGRIMAEVTWERTVVGADGFVSDASGTAVLVFDRFGSILKLTDQQGDAPFPPGT